MDLGRMSLSWVDCHLLIMQQPTVCTEELFYRSIIIFCAFLSLFPSPPPPGIGEFVFYYVCNLKEIQFITFHRTFRSRRIT